MDMLAGQGQHRCRAALDGITMCTSQLKRKNSHAMKEGVSRQTMALQTMFHSGRTAIGKF